MRRSVMSDISRSTPSPVEHVTTSVDMTDPTLASSAPAPPVAAARTMSRSDRIPSIRAAVARHDECADAAFAELTNRLVQRRRLRDRRDLGALRLP